MTRLSAALLGVALLAACAKKPSDAPRRIVRAYQAFQAASPADRPAALADLVGAPCDDAKTCDARDACVTYAKSIERARELTQKARELGPEDGGGNGAATESERAIILAAAQDAVEAAERAQTACDRGMMALTTGS